jgi:hypothetical protein
MSDPDHEATKAALALTQRLDQGELTSGQLELAGHLGHAPAQVALDRPPTGQPEAGWERALADWERPVLVRAALACGLWGLPLPLGEDLRPVEAVIEAAQAWLGNPSEAMRVGARMAHDELVALRKELEAKDEVGGDFAFELDLAEAIVQLTSDSRPEAPAYHFGLLLDRVASLPGDEPAECLEAVRQTLLAWALGEPGPLDG